MQKKEYYLMLEILTNNKYDDKTTVISDNTVYTILDLKRKIAGTALKLKDKKQNIVILNSDNYSFIIQFFACIFSEKNIYLVTDKNRLNDIDFDYDIAPNEFEETENPVLQNIDTNNTIINFYTSGSSGIAKVIKKSLFNLIREAQDLGREFNLKNKDYTVMSTTSMCHLFGLTFHLMFPIFNGLKIYTNTISLPEHVNLRNSILVSTPAFLSCIPKYNANFTTSPDYIISAGSKLQDNIFEYLEKSSNIIEIYGSTETGIIANKTHFNTSFKLFSNVNVNVNDNNIEVISDYVFEGKTTINDSVEIKNRELHIKSRTDRLYKINEKRISAEELENKLQKNPFVKASYITQNEDKLVCLCALTPCGQEFLLKNNITELIKNLKQHLLKYSEIIPQRWKFIDEIPMTQTGKINRKLIKHLFNINLSLPIIFDRLLEENSITFKIFFYNQCNFFNGHFPSFKLVPGVLQLYLAKEFANLHFNLDLGQGQWKRIKFSNIIEPDSIINLKLEKNDKQVNYEYFSKTKKYASGVFLCDNIFKGL